MQIQLKQAEIIAALKQYISDQGINLTGKDVSISFTAGRKESGITADLVIEDAGIPGFFDVEPAAATTPGVLAAPMLKVVETTVEEAKVDAEPLINEAPAAVAKTPTSLFS